MDSHSVLYLLAGLGTVNGFVFGVYLLLTRVGKKNANFFLGIFLILLSIRIFRSVHFYYSGIDLLVYYIGHGSFFLSLPFIYFYYKATFRNTVQFSRTDLIHLIPVFTLTIHSFRFVNLVGFFVFLVYIFMSHQELIQFKKRVQPTQKALKSYHYFWHRNLLILLYVSVILYSLNLIYRIIPYITGALSYTFLLYLMVFYWNRHQQYHKQKNILRKYQNSGLSESEADRYKSMLFEKIKSEKLYTDSTLTLNKLAELISIPYYQLSQIINQKLGKNFTEFINEYRIEEAKRLLSHPDYMDEKIESISFDAGFNTPSAFYAAFKKFTNTTPSQFRKEARLKQSVN
jgi:AraC-like DNA-binding protein